MVTVVVWDTDMCGEVFIVSDVCLVMYCVSGEALAGLTIGPGVYITP